MKNPDIKRTETTSRELHAIEFIAGLDERLHASRGYLEKRLRSVPDLYRQYRIAETAVTKVVDGLYDTMDNHSLNHLLKVCSNSEIIIRPRSVLNRKTDAQVCLTTDLTTIVNEAVRYSCAMCLKTGSEIKKCKLRKALLNVAPLDKANNGSLCGYSHVAHDLEEEENAQDK